MISWRRLRALIWKEFLQVSRDPSSILIAMVLPMLLLFIFGYGVSLDSENVPVGVVVMEDSAEAIDFYSALEGSPYLRVRRATDIRHCEEDLVAGRLRGIVVLPEDFGSQVLRPGGYAPIQVVTDGSNPQQAAFVDGYVRGAWQRWQELRAAEQGRSFAPVVEMETRVWYNSALTSRYFLVPGSIAIVLTVVGALLTALVIAREWERGTMEALLSSPISRAELLLGKIIPYYLLGLVAFTLCVVTAIGLFGIPLRGQVLTLYLLASMFLLGALGLGLTISAATKNQFLASQAAINAAFLPAFMLSGFIFEIRSMPQWIQVITYIFPARYFVGGLQTVFLSGDVWAVLWPQLGALAVIAVVFMVAISKNLQRTLD